MAAHCASAASCSTRAVLDASTCVQDSCALGVEYDPSRTPQEPVTYTPMSTHIVASSRLACMSSTNLASVLAMPKTVPEASQEGSLQASLEAFTSAQEPSEGPQAGEAPRPRRAPAAKMSEDLAVYHSVTDTVPATDFTLGSTYGSLTRYAILPSTVSSCATGGVGGAAAAAVAAGRRAGEAQMAAAGAAHAASGADRSRTAGFANCVHCGWRVRRLCASTPDAQLPL
jgi:hypothetical protein